MSSKFSLAVLNGNYSFCAENRPSWVGSFVYEKIFLIIMNVELTYDTMNWSTWYVTDATGIWNWKKCIKSGAEFVCR